MPRAKLRTLPKPGSSFKKRYKGDTHILSVVEQKGCIRYRLNGQIFNNPSAAARSLTHYEVNGWLFWSIDK